MSRWTKDQMAARVARDIHDGAVVNLGIGLPTLVANHLGAGKEVMLHSENGVIGMGPSPAPGAQDYDLINAGKQPVTLLPGGVYFHQADSFGVMMEHTTKGGEAKIVPRCSYPITGLGCVSRLYTDLAVLDITLAGMWVREMAEGLAFAALQACTGVPLIR